MESLNRKQYLTLQSFYFAMYCQYQEGIKTSFSNWSQILDDLNISWSIQNSVAAWACNKSDNAYYLSTLLKQRLNVDITNK